MKTQFLETTDYDLWSQYLRHLKCNDVYFSIAHHKLYENNGDGKAMAFVCEHESNLLFYPFFLRPIDPVATTSMPGEWFDIETVYGYTGPLSSTTENKFLDAAWGEFFQWCSQKHVVAEFIRFHPQKQTEQYATAPCKITQMQNTVWVDLSGSEEALSQSYTSVQRNMLRKARKNDLRAVFTTDRNSFEVFCRLYIETMIRLGAKSYYHFSPAYFEYLWKNLGKTVLLCTVVNQTNTIVSGALFLVDDKTVHYHLAGSDPNFRKLAPNNLLLHTAAKWGLQNGFQYLNLGGGHSPDPKDALFRFKASLSKNWLPFHVGKRIHNNSAYEILCSDWLARSGKPSAPNHFLLYRLNA